MTKFINVKVMKSVNFKCLFVCLNWCMPNATRIIRSVSDRMRDILNIKFLIELIHSSSPFPRINFIFDPIN